MGPTIMITSNLITPIREKTAGTLPAYQDVHQEIKVEVNVEKEGIKSREGGQNGRKGAIYYNRRRRTTAERAVSYTHLDVYKRQT